MLTIAFDVNGTLDGSNSHNVIKFLRHCQKKGHDVIIWSNCHSSAKSMAKKLRIPQSKAISKKYAGEPLRVTDPYIDLAVDDDICRCQNCAGLLLQTRYLVDVEDLTEHTDFDVLLKKISP